MPNTLLLASLAIGSAVADQLKCGVGTNSFPDCPKCMETAMQSGAIDFWWNWDHEVKLDMSGLSPEVVAKAQRTFTPMIWGTELPSEFSFLASSGEYVMGFNEPDQYGPACAGESTAGVFGCGKGDYRAATSAGFAALFDPAKAALEWQKMINKLAAAPEAATGTVRKIAAPAMAQAAAPVDDCSADPALPDAIKYCKGWLQVFKKKTLSLQCRGLDGKTQNCWDVVSALPIHAYGRTAAEIKQKIQEYHKVFLDDFEGTGGRTKKTLWLTEVTMGTNDATELSKFVDDLMNAKDGLQNRKLFSYVSRISWFSEWSMGAFTLGSYVPKKYEAWSSSLFEPTTGHLTPHGERFISQCSAGRGMLDSSTTALPARATSIAASTTTSQTTTTPQTTAAPTSKTVMRCSMGDSVDCPGGQATCAGNQCCPDGSTCPSADESFKGCADVKTDDCTKRLSSDARLLLLAAGGHRLLSAMEFEQSSEDL